MNRFEWIPPRPEAPRSSQQSHPTLYGVPSQHPDEIIHAYSHQQQRMSEPINFLPFRPILPTPCLSQPLLRSIPPPLAATPLLPPPPPPPTPSPSESRSRNGKQRRRPVKKRQRINSSPTEDDPMSFEAFRSREFNLTLDVQNLQQEINQLRVFREMLHSRAVVLRHDAHGSCVRTAEEFHRLFKTWYHPDVAGIKEFSGRISEKRQKEFIWSAMDENIDCGDGIVGVSQMWEQMKSYARFMKPLVINANEYRAVQSDREVLVESRGDCKILISRQTVQEVFPHALAYQHIVNQLTGQVLDVKFRFLFFFNEQQRVHRYVLDLDLVNSFMKVLGDPQDVAMLMGRALIGTNYSIFVNDHKPSATTSRSKKKNEQMIR